MNKKILLYSGLAATGFLFLAADDPSAEPRYVAALRPQPTKNIPSVPNAGYLVITSSGGEWICDRRDVMSVSCHTYELAGSTRVWEVTISERSSNSVRYYYTKPIQVEPVRAGSPSEEGAGGKLDSLSGQSTSIPAAPTSTEEKGLKVPVRKVYPEATHAHTIEFRVSTLDELNDIYAYLTLMVYGWSPKIERPPDARKLRTMEVTPVWQDWNNTESTPK